MWTAFYIPIFVVLFFGVVACAAAHSILTLYKAIATCALTLTLTLYRAVATSPSRDAQPSF